MAVADRARRGLERLGGDAPEVVVRSPGRVNLVGDHTDYNDGLALPMAIDRELVVAAARRDDGRLRLWSELDDRVVEVDAATLDGPSRWPGWTVYVQGVLREARRGLAGQGGPRGRDDLVDSGLDLAVASDLPEGAGLSSSAALELAVAHVAADLHGTAHDPLRAAHWGQAAENDWVGVSTGLLDQVTVAVARAGHALLLDCATTTWRHVALPADRVVLVLDTGARRSLVGSAYDDRRADCEEAVARLGVASPRDLDRDDLPDLQRRLPARLAARLRHVLTENDRVRAAAAALEAGDDQRLGAALAASHASLRDDYEVTGPELDTMADLANAMPGIIGARMTGGGFAGAVVAVARPGEVDLDALLGRYRAVHALQPTALVVRAVDATSPLD